MAKFGWAHISGLQATGGDQAVQFASGSDGYQSGSSDFTFDYYNNVLTLTGSMEVSGTIKANVFDVHTITKTQIDISGNTNFGNDASDNHNFTGSVFTTANVTLGDAASDVTTVTGRLTGSQGAYFASNVGVGTAVPDFTLAVTGSGGFQGLVLSMGFGNRTTVSANATVPPDSNFLLYGPITISSGTSLTVGANCNLKIKDISDA